MAATCNNGGNHLYIIVHPCIAKLNKLAFPPPAIFLYKMKVATLPSVASATFLRPYMVVELKVLLKSILFVLYFVFYIHLVFKMQQD